MIAIAIVISFSRLFGAGLQKVCSKQVEDALLNKKHTQRYIILTEGPKCTFCQQIVLLQ